jgi:cardiolipin synthase
MVTSPPPSSTPSSHKILTIPNLLSLARVLISPLFVWLIVHEGTELLGLLVFGAVSATDWVDGYVARRTGQVSELGKVLVPAADRVAIAAALVALVVRGIFPLWAALLILVRDLVIVLASAALLVARAGRIDVRFVGKVATLGLMSGVPLVAWGNLGLMFPASARALGWTFYAVGIIEYYIATILYGGDLRRALRLKRSTSSLDARPSDLA